MGYPHSQYEAGLHNIILPASFPGWWLGGDGGILWLGGDGGILWLQLGGDGGILWLGDGGILGLGILWLRSNGLVGKKWRHSLVET